MIDYINESLLKVKKNEKKWDHFSLHILLTIKLSTYVKDYSSLLSSLTYNSPRTGRGSLLRTRFNSPSMY